MAITKVINDLIDLNATGATKSLKMPSGAAYSGTTQDGMVRNDTDGTSQGSASTMQHFNGTDWKNYENVTPAPVIIPSTNSVSASITTITFANDHIYSTHNGTTDIIKYNIDGSQDSSFVVSYSNMTSIADNRAGTVFYARMTNNRVRYFNYSGTYLGGLFNDTSGNDHTFFDGTTLWTGGSGSTVYGRNIAAATDSTFSLSTYTFNEGCYVNSTQKIWMVDGNALREYTPVFTGAIITSFQASSPAVTVAGWGSAVRSITYDYTNDLVYTLEQSSSNNNWYLVQRPPALT